MCFKMKQKLFNRNNSVFLEDKHIYNYDFRLSIELTADKCVIRDNLCKASKIHLHTIHPYAHLTGVGCSLSVVFT